MVEDIGLIDFDLIEQSHSFQKFHLIECKGGIMKEWRRKWFREKPIITVFVLFFQEKIHIQNILSRL